MADNDDLELTQRERDRLEGLGRESEPPGQLEDRIVAALQREGILRRTPWHRRAVPLPIAAAAGFILFGAGAFAGRATLTSEHAATPASAGAPAREPPPGGVLVVWM